MSSAHPLARFRRRGPARQGRRPSNLDATRSAQETAQALAVAAALTGTAETWTDTPTPTRTPNLAETQRAQETVQARAVAQALTGTAEAWTDTPTATATATLTPSATRTPTNTPPPTATSTRTNTPTLTPSATFTLSHTPPATATPTPSLTPSATVLPPTTNREPPPKPTLTTTPPVFVSVKGEENLNLRAGPGTQYPVVGFLPTGVEVPVVGRTLDNLWYVIEIDNIQAWVASWLVNLNGNLNSVGIANPPDEEGLIAITPILLLITPSRTPTAATTATLLATGTVTTATPGPLPLTGTPRPSPAPAGTVFATVRTGGNRLNVRSGPGLFFPSVGFLANGATVQVIGRTDEANPWYKIVFEDEDEAWIAGWLTEVQGNINRVTVAASPPTPEGYTAPPANPVFSGGTAAGGFELGGQAQDFGAAIPYMQRAGMTWVKFQLRYGLGQDPCSAAGLIGQGPGAGFKVLLSVVGEPNEMAAVGFDNYFQQFASFLGGVAALGADGIEVWNEPNIDREWPTGQIDPALYTRMLAAAYNAIKGSNPSTLVISAAPAPTGAESWLGTDRVWNDDRYVAGLSAAGGTAYMDCLGAHYNQGDVPPSWTSGSPQGGHYSFYLSGMISVYTNAIGGARPLCFTELGYVTPEGYGALPAWFAWGQNNTVAQQAAWLAQAAVIASSSGARLMIVWNVNFTGFGDDPHAGYAIVRPGGGCPACDTLGQVMAR